MKCNFKKIVSCPVFDSIDRYEKEIKVKVCSLKTDADRRCDEEDNCILFRIFTLLHIKK